ncbi:mechanosensitive ion channel protein MscS [Vibrio galatheae]|uniref:Small-conductance mechanosensitive channel n=1 Tax=Vibrio galatheae TaxID=579748 RepID=A0A0F4NL32_9VIBR|nr:mechanosensitive ion channel family protein [Vibrio galatheae]KJY82736.1 mechanosensitive ion channel protein MscS [Vibrio galatheae]
MKELMFQSQLVNQVLIGIALLSAYILLRRIGKRAILSLAEKKQVSSQRSLFVIKAFNVSTFFVFISLFTLLLGLGYGDISLFLSSIFAVLGVALFAQWSILSNLTASFLIFFVFPYRIGDKIKVCDKDEDVSGVIIDITMFHVILRHENSNMITYPNNLILQKGVIKLLATPSSEANESQ